MRDLAMNQHMGSNFDDFLAEEGILEEVTAERCHMKTIAVDLPERITTEIGALVKGDVCQR